MHSNFKGDFTYNHKYRSKNFPVLSWHFVLELLPTVQTHAACCLVNRRIDHRCESEWLFFHWRPAGGPLTLCQLGSAPVPLWPSGIDTGPMDKERYKKNNIIKFLCKYCSFLECFLLFQNKIQQFISICVWTTCYPWNELVCCRHGHSAGQRQKTKTSHDLLPGEHSSFYFLFYFWDICSHLLFVSCTSCVFRSPAYPFVYLYLYVSPFQSFLCFSVLTSHRWLVCS